MNHVVLIGEVTHIRNDGVTLLLDNNLEVSISMSSLFMEVINSTNQQDMFIAIRGSLALDEDNKMVVRADKLQILEKERYVPQHKKHNDITL